MIPVFFHFQQVSLPWERGEDQMPLKRPDGRWGIIKVDVINELSLRVSTGDSAPELMDAFSETTGHFFLQYGVSYKSERASSRRERKEWVL